MRAWDVRRVARADDGAIVVVMRLAADAETHALWPGDFEASLSLSLGPSLAMTFEVENRDRVEITYEVALHTYLTVGDVEQIRILGLERAPFIDKVAGMAAKTAGAEPLALDGEVDRVFTGTRATCIVDDPVLRRRIRIEKSESATTVVWNPGGAKGEAMADVGADAWRRFVCVETANCAPDTIRLASGARHAMSARLHVE